MPDLTGYTHILSKKPALEQHGSGFAAICHGHGTYSLRAALHMVLPVGWSVYAKRGTVLSFPVHYTCHGDPWTVVVGKMFKQDGYRGAVWWGNDVLTVHPEKSVMPVTPAPADLQVSRSAAVSSSIPNSAGQAFAFASTAVSGADQQTMPLPLHGEDVRDLMDRAVQLRSLAMESVLRELSHAMGYRLQVQGNPSTVSLAGVLSRGTMTAKQALSAIGSLSTVDITVNEPKRLLQVRIFSSTSTVAAPPTAATPSSSVSVPYAGVQPQETASAGLPAALKRKVTLQRGDLQSVLRQIAAITGYQVRLHPSAPMGVIGDGLPWGKPVAAAVILHKIGKQSYLDVQVLPQARRINVTVNL